MKITTSIIPGATFIAKVLQYISLMVLVLFPVACNEGGRKAIDKSADAQKGRADIIQELTEKGLFAKIEDSDPPHVSLCVKPAWYGLDFEKKEIFSNIVYSYYFDGTRLTDSVTIKDAMTGKRIGQYSLATGGLKLAD